MAGAGRGGNRPAPQFRLRPRPRGRRDGAGSVPRRFGVDRPRARRLRPRGGRDDPLRQPAAQGHRRPPPQSASLRRIAGQRPGAAQGGGFRPGRHRRTGGPGRGGADADLRARRARDARRNEGAEKQQARRAAPRAHRRPAPPPAGARDHGRALAARQRLQDVLARRRDAGRALEREALAVPARRPRDIPFAPDGHRARRRGGGEAVATEHRRDPGKADRTKPQRRRARPHPRRLDPGAHHAVSRGAAGPDRGATPPHHQRRRDGLRGSARVAGGRDHRRTR